MDAEAYADMLPWLVFIVVDRKTGLDVTWAAASSAVCSLGLVAWCYRRGLRSILPRLGLVVFSVCLVVALAVPWWDGAVSVSRAVMVGTLSVAALVSLWGTPLSEGYTIAMAAPVARRDPRFRRVNVEITAAWAAATAIVALACGTTAVLADPYAFTFFGWVAPLVVAGAAVLWTTRRWDLFHMSVEASSRADAPTGPVLSIPHAFAERDPDADDAVIHPFPLRRRRDA